MTRKEFLLKREYYKAVREGNFSYAHSLKEKYRELVMQKLTQSYHQREEKLKQFPVINLN